DKTSSEQFVCRVNIKDISLVTSGDYIRYYYVGNEKYHHIIDPDTLMPSKYFAAVSVFVNNSGLADALSTALFSMSYEDGLRLIKSVGGEAIWVTSDGELFMSDGVELVDK
ncbi:MAG: FAD:protein FMN transferase, partial [Clostridia bacterium]|nr:FAD:protein FMN transferase [Clostridia bacterium]